MVDIPPEIIPDILRRLPAKSLCRFKSVSKSWLAEISEPQFHKDHLNTVKLTRLICDQSPILTLPHPLHNEETQKLSLFFHSTDSYFFFYHGSCNGLVLGSATISFAHKPRGIFDRLVILNPTTKEFIKLSETHYETLDHEYSNHSCGIGYDCVTDDYKVVTIAKSVFVGPPIYVHVYSLKTNTWRRVPDYPYIYDHYSYSFNQEKVLVNECLHWIATKRIDDTSTFLQVIVGFSLADEEFCEVPSPDWGNDVNMKVCKLVAFGENLGIFVGDGVWLMNEYGVRRSWSKITINGFIDTSRSYDNSYFKPLFHFEDGKILLVTKNLLWVYDVEEECFIKTVNISKKLKGMINGTYVESLVSLKSSSTLTIHKLTNSRPVTPQNATGRGGGRDDGTSGGRGRSGGRDGGTSGRRGRSGARGGGRGRSGARGRFGGGGRDGGRGGRGRY